MEENIPALVRRLESDFTSGTTHKSEFVDESLYEDINKIEAYLASKHTSGSTDSQNRDKPFFNIVVSARNIWYRATDIDRNQIRCIATKNADVLSSFLATAKLQEWMKRENFGKFLNVWGLNLATYNYAWTKFVEQDGRLIPTNIPWTRIICDNIDPEGNPKIEILELTPAQLRSRKGYDQTKVKDLIEAVSTRKQADGSDKDTKSDYIRVYEVHGEFSQYALKISQGKKATEADKDIFSQQIHVVSFVKGKEEGQYDEFTLYSGIEDDPYLLTYLIPSTDGSISLNGAVKSLFEPQWMVNHTAKSIKDQLDLASKQIFQTSDGSFIGRNALTQIENGDILVWSPENGGSRLEQVNNTSHDTVSIQNFQASWKSLGNEMVGISDLMLGASPKAGSAWRQTEAILQENHNLFELMTENKGLAIEEMLRRFILPYLKKKLDTTDEIVATLSDYGIDKIEAKYIQTESVKRVNSKYIKAILDTPPGIMPMVNGQPMSPETQQADIQAEQQNIKGELNQNGDKRFIKPSEVSDKTWKEVMKDYEWEAECDITGESINKDAATTLNTMLTFFANKRGMPLSPEEKLAVNKIFNLTGTVSNLELSDLNSQPAPSPMQPPDMVGGVGGKLPVTQ